MPATTTIDNPILNSPYREPARHFRFDANNEVTSIIDSGRRDISYFLPIATPKKKTAPGLFDTIKEKTGKNPTARARRRPRPAMRQRTATKRQRPARAGRQDEGRDRRDGCN